MATVNIHFEAACDRDTARILFVCIFLVALNVWGSLCTNSQIRMYKKFRVASHHTHM